ncbi:DUF1345 domain-containing protein [Microbacterium pumilum]|uniref:DUF1345 domain-containing protein n=1 Tax=Microbacterium pumilum TaxID=344165 RepID=A0ABN2SV92_9MICO
MAESSKRASALLRLTVALAVGVLAAVAVAPFLGLAAGFLAGWAGVAATSVSWILRLVWPMDASETRQHATREDPALVIARITAVMIGSVASLGAVAVVLIQTRIVPPFESYSLAGIAVVAVASSWALIQADYMLRIARVYYSDPVGGIDFNQVEDPVYTDFAYLAFALGMTYQVADTGLRTNQLRRIVLGQTFLAYLFGAVILATIINLVTGLG